MSISFAPRLCLSLLLLLGALGVRPVRAAEDTIWSGLIYATNETAPSPAPREIAAYDAKLQHIFGYNQLVLLGQHREQMDAPLEHWMLPGKGVSLLVSAKRARENYLLDVQLYQENRMAVRTVALLARQSPIFLRGPLYGEGQLIIVLAVQ